MGEGPTAARSGVPNAPTATLSSTVASSSRIDVWKVRLTPALAICQGLRPVTSVPWNWTVPASGLLKPVIRFSTVDLPAPLGPMSPWMAPDRHRRETSRTACTPP